MRKKKKSRIRIIVGLVICCLFLAGTAGLVLAEKKVSDSLINISEEPEKLKDELNEVNKRVTELTAENQELKNKLGLSDTEGTGVN